MASNKNSGPNEATVNQFQAWIDSNVDQSEIKPKKVYNNENSQTLSFENVRIDFPLRPYPAQVQMMKRIIHTLNESENALLESPTGSGKSLALLCSVLAWREDKENKVAKEMKLEIDKNEKMKHESKKVVEIEIEGNLESKETTIEISLESDNLQESKNTLKEIPVNIPIQGEPINLDSLPEIKRALDENDPSNWRKKFKRENSVITINENSFEDFQSSGMKKEAKEEDNIQQRPDSEKVTNMKYETFNKVPRIFVGSRTHKQISQLISELKTKTRYNPRTTILGSRDQLCIHPKVSKAANKTEACIELMDKNACHYKHKFSRILTHHSLSGADRVWDIEDLVTLGKKVKGCPFYASRKLYEGAEVVFCPYNYIIDPLIRKVLDINLKGSIIILDEAHNIEDSSRSAGSFEVDEQKLGMVKKELDQIIRNRIEVQAHQTLEVIVNYLYDWITSPDNNYTVQEYEAHHCNWTGVSILQKLQEGDITPFIFHDALKPAFSVAASHADKVRKEKENNSEEVSNHEIESSQSPFFHRKCLSTTSLSTLQGIFMVLGFLFKEETHFEEDYQMVLTKKIERAQKSQPMTGKRRKKGASGYMEPEWSFKLAFKCLNPGIIFKDMTETTRSVILTSGTLSPLNTFASELETDFEGRLEANHVIDKSHVWVGGIPQGPNRVSLKGIYSNWESFHFQDDLGEALCEIVESVPFGVLCFLPAYNTLDKLMQRWKLTKLYKRLEARKLIFTEPRGSDKLEFENTIGAFYGQVDKVKFEPDDEGRDGALFFAVFRGKVSEGIDFADNYCRAVVTIGIPYPAVKDLEVKFKKEYNDKRKSRVRGSNHLTGGQWYSSQAFRAINQALGRCIRHKNDWGAIILLEDRFFNTDNVNQLSKWVRNQFRMHQNFPSALMDLRDFIRKQVERTAIPAQETIAMPLENVSQDTPSKLPMDQDENITTVDDNPNTSTSITESNHETPHSKNSSVDLPNDHVFDIDILSIFSDEEVVISDTLNDKTTMGNVLITNELTEEIRTIDTLKFGQSPLNNPTDSPPLKTSRVYTSGAIIYSPEESNTDVSNTSNRMLLHADAILSSPNDWTTDPPLNTYDLTGSTPPTTVPVSIIPQAPALPTSSPNTSSLKTFTPYVSILPLLQSSGCPIPEGALEDPQNISLNVSPSAKLNPTNSSETKYNVAKEIETTNAFSYSKDTFVTNNLTPNDNLTVGAQETKTKFDLLKTETKTTQDHFEFKAPNSPPSVINAELWRKDFFSIANSDTSRVKITCSCCDRFLLEGSTRNILPVNIRDLTFITKNYNLDNGNMVELLEPSKWECNVDLSGGPIDINRWPNESSVTLNAVDGICYRSLHCLCPVSKTQGVVIRQSFGDRNSKYDGKVYLWLTQLRIKRTKGTQSHLNYQPEDSVEIASSQVSSINDMFYNL